MNPDKTITLELIENESVNIELGKDLAHSDIAWMLTVLQAHLWQSMLDAQENRGEFAVWDLPDKEGVN